jgi:hypothetical protein
MTTSMKSLTLVGVLLATLFATATLTTTPVEARHYCPRGGYCPVGTCTRFNPWARVQYACVVATCTAANCER